MSKSTGKRDNGQRVTRTLTIVAEMTLAESRALDEAYAAWCGEEEDEVKVSELVDGQWDDKVVEVTLR